jgi:hypothetical protein
VNRIAPTTNRPLKGVFAPASKEKVATDGELTAELASRIMGWKVTRDRLVKAGRSWLPRWRFAPLHSLEDVFQLLDRAKSDYKLVAVDNGTFTASVRVRGRVGEASGEPKARTITIALAHAIGLQLSDEIVARVSQPAHHLKPIPRSKINGV